jgi:hypothetical protein
MLSHDEEDLPGEGMRDDIEDITPSTLTLSLWMARNQEIETLMNRRAYLWKAYIFSTRY